jgi:hypothetical protein
MSRGFSYSVLGLALICAYLAHVVLVETETRIPDVLRSVAIQRKVLERQVVQASDSTARHTACHTRIHTPSYTAFKIDLPMPRPATETSASREHGGTRLGAGTCMSVNDHGLRASDGNGVRMRVTNVGQVELVVDAEETVVLATWPPEPLLPLSPPNLHWNLCLQLDGNLCLANGDQYVQKDGIDTRCWSSTPVSTTALSPLDGVVLRGNQDLCLDRISSSDGGAALHSCHSRLWHTTPTPDQLLATSARAAVFYMNGLIISIGVLLLLALGESLYAMRTKSRQEDDDDDDATPPPFPWASPSLQQLAKLIDDGAPFDTIEAHVSGLFYESFLSIECTHMARFLGDAGLFSVQTRFCTKAADSRVLPEQRARLYKIAIMNQLVWVDDCDAWDSALELALQCNYASVFEAFGVRAATHGHVEKAVKALHRARSIKCWSRVLELIEDINARPCVIRMDTDVFREYITWIRIKVGPAADLSCASAADEVRLHATLVLDTDLSSSSVAEAAPSSSSMLDFAILGTKSSLPASDVLPASPLIPCSSSSALASPVNLPATVSSASAATATLPTIDLFGRTIAQVKAYKAYVAAPPTDLSEEDWLVIDTAGRIERYSSVAEAMHNPRVMTDPSLVLRQYPSEKDFWSLLRSLNKSM